MVVEGAACRSPGNGNDLVVAQVPADLLDQLQATVVERKPRGSGRSSDTCWQKLGIASDGVAVLSSLERSARPFVDAQLQRRHSRSPPSAGIAGADRAGINRWSTIRALTDLELSQRPQRSRIPRNLKRLRGELVCGLNLPPQDAALLMHAGIATQPSAACSPNDSWQTGRLGGLGTKRLAAVDLRVASD